MVDDSGETYGAERADTEGPGRVDNGDDLAPEVQGPEDPGWAVGMTNTSGSPTTDRSAAKSTA